MSAMKASPAAPDAETGQYIAAVEAVEGAELKGATMPYTSVNGNMYSFLDKSGVLAIRLDEAGRKALTKLGGIDYIHETGVAMREYVTVPPKVLSNSKKATVWIGKSLAYAKTLKPKATKRKKRA